MPVLNISPRVAEEDILKLKTASVDDLLDSLKAQDAYIRVAVGSELNDRMFALPNVLPNPNSTDSCMCAYCGISFRRESIRTIPNHFLPDGTCASGFTKDYKCVCKRQFSTLEEANRHRINAGCLAYKQFMKTIYCEPCKFQALNKKYYDEHCSSKSHYKTTHIDEFYCKECDLRCRCKAEFEAHKESKRHNPKSEHKCEICNVECRTQKEYERHCAGKQHEYKLNPISLTCETCNITCLSRKQMETHVATKKHLKNCCVGSANVVKNEGCI
jgi:hypothetical protein